MAGTLLVKKGDRGCDFLSPYPNIPAMQAAGVTWVMFYLKAWDPKFIPLLSAAGIGGLPISEHTATSSLLGEAEGRKHGIQGVADCVAKGVPKGTVLTLTHDTSAINDVVDDYFWGAEQEVRAGGYGFGGYVSRLVVDQCRARGVTFDLITAPAATAWLGGRHPDSDIWQFTSRVLYGVRVDPLQAMKDFSVLGPRKPPPPPQIPQFPHLKEDEVSKVCNSLPMAVDGVPGDITSGPDAGKWSPGKVLFELIAGKARHIPGAEGPCWDAAEFRPVDPAVIMALPVYGEETISGSASVSIALHT